MTQNLQPPAAIPVAIDPSNVDIPKRSSQGIGRKLIRRMCGGEGDDLHAGGAGAHYACRRILDHETGSGCERETAGRDQIRIGTRLSVLDVFSADENVGHRKTGTAQPGGGGRAKTRRGDGPASLGKRAQQPRRALVGAGRFRFGFVLRKECSEPRPRHRGPERQGGSSRERAARGTRAERARPEGRAPTPSGATAAPPTQQSPPAHRRDRTRSRSTRSVSWAPKMKSRSPSR